MNCRAVEARLDAYLDGELPGVESLQIRDHLHRCPACAAELEEARGLKFLLGGMDVPAPSEDFEARLVQTLRRAEEDERRAPVRHFLLFGGVAAASMLATLLVLRMTAPTPARAEQSVALEIRRDQAFTYGGDPAGGVPVVSASHVLP